MAVTTSLICKYNLPDYNIKTIRILGSLPLMLILEFEKWHLRHGWPSYVSDVELDLVKRVHVRPIFLMG
jgi:hypothetical protein